MSSKHKNLTSLGEYLGRLKGNQDQIFYITGESEEVIRSFPIFRKMVALDYEVLICDAAIDEYVFNHVREFDSHKLKDIGKADFIMPTEDEASRKRVKFLEDMFQPL